MFRIVVMAIAIAHFEPVIRAQGYHHGVFQTGFFL